MLHEEATDQRVWALQPGAAFGVVPFAHEEMSQSSLAAAACTVTPQGGAVYTVKRKSAVAEQGWITRVVDCGRGECGCPKPQAEGLLCTEMFAACQHEGFPFETAMAQGYPGYAVWHKLQSPQSLGAICATVPVVPSLDELRLRRDNPDYRAAVAGNAEKRGLKTVQPPKMRIEGAHGKQQIEKETGGRRRAKA